MRRYKGKKKNNIKKIFMLYRLVLFPAFKMNKQWWPDWVFWPLDVNGGFWDSGKIVTQFKYDTFSLLLTKLVWPLTHRKWNSSYSSSKEKKTGLLYCYLALLNLYPASRLPDANSSKLSTVSFILLNIKTIETILHIFSSK